MDVAQVADDNMYLWRGVSKAAICWTRACDHVTVCSIDLMPVWMFPGPLNRDMGDECFPLRCVDLISSILIVMES